MIPWHLGGHLSSKLEDIDRQLKDLGAAAEGLEGLLAPYREADLSLPHVDALLDGLAAATAPPASAAQAPAAAQPVPAVAPVADAAVPEAPALDTEGDEAAIADIAAAFPGDPGAAEESEAAEAAAGGDGEGAVPAGHDPDFVPPRRARKGMDTLVDAQTGAGVDRAEEVDDTPITGEFMVDVDGLDDPDDEVTGQAFAGDGAGESAAGALGDDDTTHVPGVTAAAGDEALPAAADEADEADGAGGADEDSFEMLIEDDEIELIDDDEIEIIED